MSKIKVNSIEAATGTTVTLPSGQTLDLSSGTVTLPNSSVNLTTKVTGTLPVANGGTGLTTLGSATQVLRVNSGATALEFASVGTTAGQVIQVVHTNYTSTTSSTSATPADVSGFSATITPASASNNILIFVSVIFGGQDDTYPYVLLKRGATSIGTGTAATGNQINTFLSGPLTSTTGASNVIRHHSKSFLDSPSSTSALTYQIQFASPYGAATTYINRPHDFSNNTYAQSSTSTITLMEIKG